MTIAASILSLAVVASAVMTVRTHHVRRDLFIELERLNAHRDRLQIEWGKLRIEQSTWATEERIERLAVDQFDLHIPHPKEMVILVAEPGH